MKEAPDKIYTDNRGVYAKLPIFLQIDANVEYIRKDLVEHIIRGALGPQDALNKIRSL